jgi:iron-sulfur cluster repair protein YtfE (RIC family)
VASAVGDLRSAIEVHLTFEERVLLPLLDAAPPAVAPRRGERLRQEHRQQRDMLAALHREATAHPGLPTLAAKLAFVTSWLLADMEEEERSMLIEDGPTGEPPPADPPGSR